MAKCWCDCDRVLAFCAGLRQRGYRIRWKAMTRVDRIDAELLREMRAAGCRQVSFGIEATCDADLRLLRKGATIARAKTAIAAARDAGLTSEGYFILGFPWQRRDDLFESAERVWEFDLDAVRLSCLTPYPGTHFGEHMREYGFRIPIPDLERFNTTVPIIETDQFTLRNQAEARTAYLARLLESEPEEESEEADGPEPGLAELPAARRPERVGLSPYLVQRETRLGLLVFDYLNGASAVLNAPAARVLD